MVHDDCIMNAMSYSCWIKIMSVLKLNHNNMTPKQGDTSYNLCAKYDYIFKTTICNMNNITEKASDNGCIDETTWAFLDMVVNVVIGLWARLESTKEVRWSCFMMLVNIILELTSTNICRLRMIHASQLKKQMRFTNSSRELDCL